jgi:hypothetical protein
MLEPGERSLVTNTTPLIALTTATGGPEVNSAKALRLARDAVDKLPLNAFLVRLKGLEAEIQAGMKELEGMLE